jgi:tetratricopeptide (TPR) repeat protein
MPARTQEAPPPSPTAGHRPLPVPTPPRETPDRVLDAAEVGFQEGRFYDAVTLARRGLALGGGTKALLLLGKIYRTTGEYERALEAYDQILRKSPGDTRAQEGRRKAVAAMISAANPPKVGVGKPAPGPASD